MFTIHFTPEAHDGGPHTVLRLMRGYAVRVETPGCQEHEGVIEDASPRHICLRLWNHADQLYNGTQFAALYNENTKVTYL